MIAGNTPDISISTSIAIVTFLIIGPGFAYKGFKKWKKVDSTEESKAKSGQYEFFFGIGLSVVAFIYVCVLIFASISGRTDNPGLQSSPPIESAESTSAQVTETAEKYVSNQLYNGATYSGYVNESRQPDGKGTMKYSDGSEYTGDWVDGVRQGQGTMKYDNGTYDGEWQNDKKNGTGTYTWNDGKKYDGAYVDDVRSGKGVFSNWVDLTNGYIGTYYGESKNDQFDGYGNFLFDNGDKFEGVYKENQYWTGTYTRKDGSQYEIVNGQPQ